MEAAAAEVKDTLPAKPMFARLPARAAEYPQPAAALQTFNATWTYNGTGYGATFVGTFPGGGLRTTFPVYIIPINLVFGSTSFDPLTRQSNGKTALANTMASPMFKSGIDFVQGGTDLGRTQYIDAYSRANFWGQTGFNPNWHLLLGGPHILPEQTISVPSGDGFVATEFGQTVGVAYMSWFDSLARFLLAANPQIQTNALALFMTYDTYLLDGSGNCCIGGYHSANGAQTYSHFSYVSTPGIFSQDVSALSHEVGEWADDPFINNTNQPCGGILEVGDPLENFANYGDFNYTLRGFTYHLQDLVLVPYFGVPPGVSVHGWFTFQGQSVSVCQYGQ